jgi:hypothetical protein
MTPDDAAQARRVIGPPESSRRPWTGREDKIVRDVLPTKGLDATAALLPGRSIHAIQQYGYRIGIKAQNTRKKRDPWSTNQHIDDAIRRIYLDPSAGAVRHLEQTLGRPRQWIRKRAEQLGVVVPRFKEPEWTDPEDAILREHASKHIDRIAKILRRAGYKRTPVGVRCRLYRLDGIDREREGVYTASDVARILGVDSKTPIEWITKGWLKARRRKTEVPQQYNDRVWDIARADLRRFVIDHVAHVDFRKVDKYFVVELLARAT